MIQMTNATILIAEDEQPLLTSLVDKFAHVGFEVLEARNGEEALRVALSRHPDAILLDLIMPKMDGLAVLDKLRKDEWGKNVPVIILTNLNMDDRIIREVTEYEPSFYLMKSEISLKDIVSKVNEVLGRE